MNVARPIFRAQAKGALQSARDRMRRNLSLCLLILTGCPRNISLDPNVDVPPRIPFLIARDVRRALEAANGLRLDAPKWRIVGGHEAAGYLVEHYRLGRGIHLLLAIDRDARAFTHQIWFDTRHLDARAGAALLEMYRDRPGSDRMEAYDFAGARTSAGISRELGFFAATAPSKLGEVDTLELIAKLEGERLGQQADPKTALARADALADPRARVDEQMVRALRKSIEEQPPPELTPERLAELAAATFAPQRLAVVVAGDVDRVQVLSLLRRAHASRGSADERAPKLSPLRASPPAYAVEVPISADDRELLIGWTIDPTKQGIPIEAAAHVLAGGEPSRLALRLGDGVAGIRARAPEGSRTLELTLILKPTTTTTKAMSSVREELEAIARGEETGRDLERARARMTREVLARASGLESRAELFASALLLGGSIDEIDLRLAALAEMTEEWLRTAVKESLGARPAMVLGTPDKEGS